MIFLNDLLVLHSENSLVLIFSKLILGYLCLP
ncbi:hypothetical protein AK40_6064 (plasmid) [Bacillus cereus 03BB108]|uniref:Uncharacterized protein n=1 Tax=Bacillus cereus 03BB108 TaxID=451709 RepID=A0AAN0SS56_BACCE|nr:hypothetical protein AK40_6064 [Bacillus cereus 03BB108]